MNRFFKEESGVLTFEWILLITVLVIGIVGGLSAVRDAMICELADVTGAMVALDQSYYILFPWEVAVPEDIPDGAVGSMFKDQGLNVFQARATDTTSNWHQGDGSAPSAPNNGGFGF